MLTGRAGKKNLPAQAPKLYSFTIWSPTCTMIRKFIELHAKCQTTVCIKDTTMLKLKSSTENAVISPITSACLRFQQQFIVLRLQYGIPPEKAKRRQRKSTWKAGNSLATQGGFSSIL